MFGFVNVSHNSLNHLISIYRNRRPRQIFSLAGEIVASYSLDCSSYADEVQPTSAVLQRLAESLKFAECNIVAFSTSDDTSNGA